MLGGEGSCMRIQKMAPVELLSRRCPVYQEKAATVGRNQVSSGPVGMESPGLHMSGDVTVSGLSAALMRTGNWARLHQVPSPCQLETCLSVL